MAAEIWSICARIEATRSPARASASAARPTSRMSARVPLTSGASNSTTGRPVARRCWSTSGLVRLASAITRSERRATIFSTSTPEKVATSGIEWASLGKSAMSWTLPTTFEPAPTANRISVAAGESDTIRSGAVWIRTVFWRSSVRVSGKVGLGEGAAVGLEGAADGPVDGTGDGEATAPVQDASTPDNASEVSSIATIGRTRKGPSLRPEGGAWKNEITVPTPFSRGFEHTAGPATGLRPHLGRRAFTVAGLCRNLTGFATTQRLHRLSPAG